MTERRVRAVEGVHRLDPYLLIDLHYAGRPGMIGAYLLPGEGGRYALVEVGPLTTLARLEEGIREAGFDPAGLTDVLVTHIHLDHAGAAGSLAQRYGATVHAFETGAPHLARPERLIASSRRVYGDAFDELMGEPEPVPEGQLHPVTAGEEFGVLGYRVRALHTPGHASSHVAYLVDDRDLFTGDAAAIRLPGTDLIRPATAPPEIDLGAWRESLERMRAAGPERLLLTHFGEVRDVATHLRLVEQRTDEWAAEILAGLRAGEEADALTRRIERLGEAELDRVGAAEEARERHRLTSDYEMTAAGLARYWRKHRPEALE